MIRPRGFSKSQVQRVHVFRFSRRILYSTLEIEGLPKVKAAFISKLYLRQKLLYPPAVVRSGLHPWVP